MAKKIEERVRDQKSMFGHVVMAVVSQQPDLQKIQRQIARALGLKLNEEDSLIYGARELHKRLMDENSILIILDDVWRWLNLGELGIPSQRTHAGCKIILTSRNLDAFISSGNPVSKIFHLEILSPEESWVLFKKNAGIQDDSHDDLIQIAKDVAKECKGLPLALKTVGLALRDARKSSWENAFGELQKSMPMNILGVREDVYKPLMYSINRLESEEARYLFLLCCLFPEDFDITLEMLVGCIKALTIFKGLESLMVARNKVETLTGILISRSLLIKSSDQDEHPCVKMHDVIRDVGIWIASEEKIESDGKIASKEKEVFMVSHGKEEWPIKEEDSYGNYTCISLIFSEKRKRDISIPKFISCPRLEFLLLDALGDDPLNLPDTFFSRMEGLRYLCASNFESLPSSVGLLNNLRTLFLDDCRIVETISLIGKLTHLEILYLLGCEFMVLPTEIGGLAKLRQLVIKDNRSLKRIAFGVISRLVQLEELVILNNFIYGEAEEKDYGITNAHLAELDCLNHLTTLKTEIRNPSVIPTMTTLPPWVSKLKEYYIVVSTEALSYVETRFQKVIIVGDKAVTPLGDWFYDMASDVDYLNVTGPSCTFFVKKLVKLKNRDSLKYLSLSKFTNVQYLIEEGQQENGAIFPMLEHLQIEDCGSLQEISNVPPPAGSFEALKAISFYSLSGLIRLWSLRTGKLCLSNLRNIKIHDCQSLSYLFSLSVAQSLSQLEELHISNCLSMENIFTKEPGGEIGIHKLEFPKLYYLEIQSLKNLHDLCEGMNRIEVFKLSYLVLKDLPSIKGKGDSGIHGPYLFDHLQMAGNFDWLKSLEVELVDSFTCFFSPSMLRGLPNLEELMLQNCSMLEEVIENDENVGETILFPKLKKLYLSTLPKILTFCCRCIELPSLEELHIEDCPSMERFSKKLSDASNLSLPFFSEEIAGNFDGLRSLELKSMNFKCLFPSMLRGLSNLKELWLENCSMLEEVIGNDKNVGETIMFPKLKRLHLFNLPKILTFCCGGIEFPSLEILFMENCPLMERFSEGLSHASNLSLSFFSNEVYCPKLKSLELHSLHNTTRMFDLSTFRALTNLECLFIYECKKLVEVIVEEEVDGLTNIKEILSPQLEFLELRGLPMIKRFCHTKRSLEFPSLKYVRIRDCPMLERFSLGTLHLPNITSIRGNRDADFANKFFYNKEISSDQVHLEKDCFIISLKQMSIKGINDYNWFLAPYSSENFIDVVSAHGSMVEITGTFEIAMLVPGVVYEIIFMIMLDEDVGDWVEGVEFELKLLEGITQHQVKTLSEQPRGKWIDHLIGKFTRKHYQTNLEFSLSQRDTEFWKYGLLIHGVKFIKSLEC